MEKFTQVTVDGVVYKLRFSINAMIAVEQATGHKVTALGDELKKMGKGDMNVVLLRHIFHALLGDYHPELSLGEAGLMMSDMGLLEAAGVVSQAMLSAFPEAKEKPVRGKPKPRTPRVPKPAPELTGVTS